ncbi:hypothetical protein V8D89_010309 [Ganoderma adspersum]
MVPISTLQPFECFRRRHSWRRVAYIDCASAESLSIDPRSSRPQRDTPQTPTATQLRTMGAIFSAIGSAINAVVSAIADIIMIIVSVIVTIIVTIFDVIFDILCCNCFGGRTKRTGTHSYRFGRRGAAAV